MPWSHPPPLKVGEQGPNSCHRCFFILLLGNSLESPKKIEEETQEES